MTITINGTGTVTGVTTLATTNVSQTLTTPVVTTTIGVGAATPSASGAGITFPAIQSASSDANTLDDYEEGTWTPALLTNGGNTFTQSGTGIYTKIGNMVTASGIVIWTAKSGSGALQISLPFTTPSNGSWRGGVTLGTIVNMSVVSGTRFMIASLDPSSAFFSIRYINNVATWGPLDPSNMWTSGEFQFTAVYPV